MERTRWPGVYKRGKRYAAVAALPGGRQRWVSAATATEARALKAATEAEAEAKARPARRGEEQLVAEIVNRWMAAHERDWKPNTKAARESVFRIHVEPAIGECTVGELLEDREHLRALYRGVSPAVARNVREALRGAFRWARLEGLIDADPTDLVKPPRYSKPEARYLDLEDVRRLRDLVAGGPFEGAVVLGLLGCRAAEAAFVRWGDVAGNVLHIRGSSWGGRTKTGKTRSLTLPAGDVAGLRAFKLREAERLLAVGIRQDDRTHILTDPLGDPMPPNHLGAIFAAFAREHGLDITYHGLRHTAASLLLGAGVDVRTVAGRLGHASATTTLATYAHMLGEADRAAADRVEALLGARSAPRG
jgi:integrase